MTIEDLKMKQEVYAELLKSAKHVTVVEILDKKYDPPRWRLYAVAETPEIANQIMMKLIDNGDYAREEVMTTTYLVHNEETVGFKWS